MSSRSPTSPRTNGPHRTAQRWPVVRLSRTTGSIPWAANVFRERDVGSALPGIVARQRLELNGGGGPGHVPDQAGKLEDGVLDRVADVDRSAMVAFHEADQPFDEVVDVLKAAGLATVAVD